MRSDALRAKAGLTAALLILALAPATASAGAAGYTVWSCRGPDGKPVSAQAWRAGGDGTKDSCAAGGALRARLGGSGDWEQQRSSASVRESWRVSGYRFALPAGATISGYRIHLYAATAKSEIVGGNQAGIDEDATLTVGDIDAGCPGPGCVFGTPDAPLADENLIARSGLAGGGLAIAARCGGGVFGCWGAQEGNDPADVRMFRSQVDLLDDHAPVLGEPSGGLVSGQPLSGSALISFSASDSGAGVAALALIVDGNEVARRAAGGACREPYVIPAPCPSELGASFEVDAAKLAAGRHTAVLSAVDGAGNATTGAPVTFTVAAPADPPPAPVAQVMSTVERLVQVPVPSPPRSVRITVARSRIALPSTGAAVAGEVKDLQGNAVAGAKVIVRSRPFGVHRAKLRTERTLTTDAEGRFATPAGSTSRLVVLDVEDGANRAQEAVELELMQRLRVDALTRDRDLRNGTVMTLRGSIEGAGGGAGGRVVLVQAIVGGRWTTVESLTADDDGEAVWRYRFSGTTRRAIYRFRMRVQRAGDIWPWPTTSSRVVRVEVSP